LDLERTLAQRIRCTIEDYEMEAERVKTAPYKPASDTAWLSEREWDVFFTRNTTFRDI
jgi:hypothetical protein